MAKKQYWQDDYWLLLMQLYLRKPVGIKPMYSKPLVELSMELHIAPEQLHARLCQISRLETPRIERIWQDYSRNPKRLSRAVQLLRGMMGFGSAGDFYEGVEIEDNVFCGPSCVFTNVTTPRAHFPVHGIYAKTLIKEGASLGANCTIVCGHSVGRSALIGSGSVVTKDVKDYALMVGVPAHQLGWVCECGKRLDDTLKCSCGRVYHLNGDNLIQE